MIRRDGERMLVEGPATLMNVTRLLEEGYALVREGVTEADLGKVTEADSSLLAATLAWMREARVHGRELSVANLPPALQTLAELYGVQALFPALVARE